MSERARTLDRPRPGTLAGRDERRAQAYGVRLLALIAPLARPRVAGLAALVVYLARAALSTNGWRATDVAYFNALADAFLHGQLNLRLPTASHLDLVYYGGRAYLHFPPFPAVVVAPLVALFGVAASDVVYTAVLAALTVALLAELLWALDQTGVAPLSVERRALLVAAIAFGSVLLILAPAGGVWATSQVVGWGCVLLATLAALRLRGRAAYVGAGLLLACATGTRISLGFNGLWLAYYLLRRDWRQPWRHRLGAAALGLAPLLAAGLLLAWYNAARFGSPLELGIQWHNMSDLFRPLYERYGYFNLHYLPNNLYYQFVAYPLFSSEQWMGGGIFWMTPVLLGAPYAVWRGRRDPLVWALVATCAVVYVPIGLVMGTGFLTFGPRYLLDLTAPLLVLTAIGIRRWRLGALYTLLAISCATYMLGSAMWIYVDYRWHDW